MQFQVCKQYDIDDKNKSTIVIATGLGKESQEGLTEVEESFRDSENILYIWDTTLSKQTPIAYKVNLRNTTETYLGDQEIIHRIWQNNSTTLQVCETKFIKVWESNSWKWVEFVRIKVSLQILKSYAHKILINQVIFLGNLG